MQRYPTACNAVPLQLCQHFLEISISHHFSLLGSFSQSLYGEPFVPRNAHIKLRGNLNQCEWFLFSARHPWGTYEIPEELSFLRHVQPITYFIISFFQRYRHWIIVCSVVTRSPLIIGLARAEYSVYVAHKSQHDVYPQFNDEIML